MQNFALVTKISYLAIKMNNSQLNNEEFNKRKIIMKSFPKTIFIQAAGPCNSSCAFCSRGSSYELFNLSLHRQRFEKNLYPYIAQAETLALTGSGEFLLLPQAQEILDFFDTTFPDVEKFFATNGSSLLPAICEKLASNKSRYTIHISLHASNPALHRTITRTDNFDKILEQVAYLDKLARNNRKIEVNLIFVATTLNIDDLPNFVRLAADLDVDKVVCYYNYVYIPAQKYLSCFFKQELTNKVFSEAEGVAKELNMQLDLPPRFGQKDYPKLNICREPFSQIMFNSEGHVLPCDAAEDCQEVLSDGKDFMDVWNSAYYQRLRKSLVEGNCSCFEHCLRANPASVNNFNAHVIHRGRKSGEEINELWGDNF
jgi:MoaA/NifB/PqqE/SkfB family radical SAM enzyme